MNDQSIPSDKRVLAVLHRMILDGKIKPGEKLTEVAVAQRFGVSRTPARLALRALEVEGLIKKREGRGFTVQDFDAGDVAQAYEVRAVLEGLAAGTMARTGLSQEAAARLEGALAQMDAALDGDLPLEARISGYEAGNIQFHETIMRDCGNPYVAFAFDRMKALPLLRLGTVVFDADKADQDLLRLRLGNMQHRIIYDAIRRGDPQRAETLMREHANQTLVYSALFTGRDTG